MSNPAYRIDPNSGALIFPKSPEVEMLQGLKGDMTTLLKLVVNLTEQIQNLQQEIQTMKEQEGNK